MTFGGDAEPFTAHRGAYELSTDPARIDLDAVHGFLAQSYWAEHIPRETVARSLANSLNFGLFHEGAQVGLARFVTDLATFGYLADVYVLPPHRGQGLATWLVGTALAHPALAGARRLLLATRNMQALYAKVGFAALAHPERFMEIHRPDLYRPLRGG